MGSAPTRASGSSSGWPNSASTSRVRRRAAARSTSPRRPGSRPTRMFSATERCGNSDSSWWMRAIPRLARLARRARRVRRARRARGVPVGAAAGRRRSTSACSCPRRSRRRARAPRPRAGRATRRRARPWRRSASRPRPAAAGSSFAGRQATRNTNQGAGHRTRGLSVGGRIICRAPTLSTVPRTNGPKTTMTRRICRSGGSSAASLASRPARSTAPAATTAGRLEPVAHPAEDHVGVVRAGVRIHEEQHGLRHGVET